MPTQTGKICAFLIFLVASTTDQLIDWHHLVSLFVLFVG